MTDNPLINLITDGRIHTLADLKATYRMLVMQTHPDAVGSDKLLRKFLEFNDHYEEAKSFLAQSEKEQHLSTETTIQNHRFEFYKQLHLIESLEMPYAFHSEENQESIRIAKQRVIRELSAWRPDLMDLYTQADAEHVRIKREKPSGPYLKHALALNIRPIIHNAIAFQLTGQVVYAKQSRQNLSAIMQKLSEGGCHSLHGLLTFMMEDLKNGAAVLE
jgi:hypothetical protein